MLYFFVKRKELLRIRYPRSWVKCPCFLGVIDPIFLVMSKIWRSCTSGWIKTSASEKGGLLRLCTPKSGFIDIVFYLQETLHFQTLIAGLRVSMQEKWILVLNCTYTWTGIWNRPQSFLPRISFSRNIPLTLAYLVFSPSSEKLARASKSSRSHLVLPIEGQT